jgi:hypothetical protein
MILAVTGNPGVLVSAAAIALVGSWVGATLAASPAASASPPLPTTQEMVAARTDVWGDAAMQQPNGPSYAFFKDLLPPLRWVNAEFRHYPIVLSAPRAPQKARLESNGGAVNPRANKKPMWFEEGVPIAFEVGGPAEPFGDDLKRLGQPEYLDGYLPVVTVRYQTKDATISEETFAPVAESYAARGAAMVRFSLAKGTGSEQARARIGAQDALHVANNAVLNSKDETLVAFSPGWKWNGDLKALVAELKGRETAELAIFTKLSRSTDRFSSEEFDHQKKASVQVWNKLLGDGAKLAVPEPIVNDAYRALLIGIYMLAVNDRLNYSAGNAYAKLYEGECGDTLRSLMLFGHLDDAPAMLKPLLQFDRKATRFHVAGHKLQLLAYFYWLTRDARTVREYEPLWRPSIDLILANRESESGLLPKDNYAGDIAEQVYSLNSNANCWRGLRDVAAMLEDMGSVEDANKLRKTAAEYREAILKAVSKSVRMDAKPPFVPVALLANEAAHDPLTATRTGSYYDLICPYIIGSEIFGQGSEHEDWLLGYMQQHGGIAMGMARTMPAQGEFKNEPGVVPLYGLRYQLALLRRDEREKALVGFYGQLAQGMTRGTFIGGEGTRFLHGDANGRSLYLPPNASSNAAWLVALRYLLIQDWDLDEDGKPDTLRLMYGVPRPWLVDGARTTFVGAPTMFGPVSLDVESKLSDGLVEVHLEPPKMAAKHMMLRVPLPAGFHVESADVDGAKAQLIGGNVIDLSGRTKPIVVKFRVRRD